VSPRTLNLFACRKLSDVSASEQLHCSGDSKRVLKEHRLSPQAFHLGHPGRSAHLELQLSTNGAGVHHVLHVRQRAQQHHHGQQNLCRPSRPRSGRWHQADWSSLAEPSHGASCWIVGRTGPVLPAHERPALIATCVLATRAQARLTGGD